MSTEPTASSHPSPPPKGTYRKLPEEVWAAMRAEYQAGANCCALAKRYGVSRSAVYYRRDRERWTRERTVDALIAPLATELSAVTIAEATLNRAVEALAQGRAADAAALIKAADAVGAFADFVARLKAKAAVGEAETISG